MKVDKQLQDEVTRLRKALEREYVVRCAEVHNGETLWHIQLAITAKKRLEVVLSDTPETRN